MTDVREKWGLHLQGQLPLCPPSPVGSHTTGTRAARATLRRASVCTWGLYRQATHLQKVTHASLQKTSGWARASLLPLPVGRQHGSRSSLERISLHTWPQPHSEYSPELMCMGSCIHSQKTHNCRLIVSQGAQSSLGDAPRSSLWASPEAAWYHDPPALRRTLVYTEAYLPIGEA